MSAMKEYLMDFELILREQIAKDIESGCTFNKIGNIIICIHCETSASIARGNIK